MIEIGIYAAVGISIALIDAGYRLESKLDWTVLHAISVALLWPIWGLLKVGAWFVDRER